MVSSSYTPGTWLGVVRSGTAVLLAPATPPALVDSLWELLAREPEVHEVLHAVTSASSGSLARIPWFGIVEFRDSLRVFLRGDIELTAQLAAGPVELNGSDVTTWTERRLSAPESYKVSVPGDAAGAAELPLGDGVVLLQSLTVGRVAAALAPMPETPEMSGTEAGGPAEVPLAEVPVAEVPIAEVPVEPVHVPEPVREVPAEHGASAETVMGLPDDDLEYTNDGMAGLPEDAGTEDAGTDDAGMENAGMENAGMEDAAAEVADAASGMEAPDAVPANELTGSYDHLWDKTVMRRIEDAAVRDEPEEEPGDQPGVEPAGPEEPADGHGDQQEAAAQEPSQVDAQPSFRAQLPVPAHPGMPAAPLIPSQQGGLIDSVPWNTGGDMPARPAGPPSFVPESFVPPSSGETPVWQSPSAVPAPEGDHDGETIMKSDLGLGTAPQVPAPAAGSGPATGPMVLARVCAQGHANPPTHAQCTGCGLALASDAVQVRRPRLGRVRVSTGELIDLDQSLVIGRQPSVSRVQGGGMPRLVQVASPSGDISRSHVEVRLEGWHVMLCDLKATNGTVLVREGQPPRRLAQNEMAILLDGDIAELGDDVSLRFEEIL
ncbi:FHA domain-containing protein [Arthrobacter sp. ISL-69]|uniref:FHA domain-containing protein n=1 Tax=Arthrobacter sp. ISL-69 TaxID=2819113 RepID=UPI001BE9092C|nr:FHA domain-containing protein [Arthrobacter sp. ISL-69]MBT2536885.1 FHA domain-containing protein [Arthrobacter sp. ISL-69]